MFIPIGFIILFLIAPDLATLCGIVALAFMFPMVSIPIVIFFFIIYCINSISEKINKEKDSSYKTIHTRIKKILLWNVDPKTAKWHQVFLLITWWILLLIIFGVSLIPLAQI